MKKFNIYTLAMLSVASLGFVGCESVAMEEDSAPKAGVSLQTITVTAEQGAATKVAIADDWDMSWEAGEQLAGYSVDSENEYYDNLYGSYDITDYSALNPFTASNVSADGSSATFTGDKASGCELRLVYPYVEGNTADYYGIEYTFELASIDVDPTADAYAAVKDNMVMVSDAVDVVDGESFVMQHVTAYLDIAVDNAKGEAIKVTSIEFAPAADSEVEFATKAKLNLNLACDESGFYSESSPGEYKINFTGEGLAIATDGSADVNVPILPFEFPAGESFVATVYFKVGDTQYYAVNTKTNSSDVAKDVVAGAYSTLTLSTADAVAILPAEITSAEVPTANIEINAAQLVVESANAAELGYMIEESEEFDGVDVTAEYVDKKKDGSATPEGAATFADAHTFDLKWLSPDKEYTVYVYAKGIEGSVVISAPVVFTAASLPAMSVTEGEITTTSVTFTPGYQNDYFETIAYDCFLAEYDSPYAHSASTIVGDTSNKRIYQNSKEPITIEDLEPGKEYIVRLAGKAKAGSNYYYTSADLKFTTEDTAGPTALADAQVFTNVSITSTIYNKTEVTFENDDYKVEFEFKHDVNYAPTLLAGTYELWSGTITKLSDESEITCEEESTITIVSGDIPGHYSFSGKMVTPIVADPAEVTDTDNKYLEFSTSSSSLSFPVKVAKTEALLIPADNAYSFFVEDGQYSSEFGLYVEFENELTPTTTFIGPSVNSAYIQRYQAGKGNVLVDGECIYKVKDLYFAVAYDAETGVYTLTNGVGQTEAGESFKIAQTLTIDPTNVAASEVTVNLTAITASGESEGNNDSGWGTIWTNEMSLSCSSEEFDSLTVSVVNYNEFNSLSSTFPTLDLEDDAFTLNCTDASGNAMSIASAKSWKVEKSGDDYTVTIKFESASDNKAYIVTYSGAISFDPEINDYSSMGW